MIPGCFRIKVKKFCDTRGLFIKTFNFEEFDKAGLKADIKEEYYSVSDLNVIRGMHYQKPPYDHIKIVCCLSGKVQDVVLDIRQNSPAFGKHISFELEAHDGQLIYMPKGVAHGFLALASNSILVYNVSTVYAPKYDSGIRWDTCGINWKTKEGLIISERDMSFENFEAIKYE